MTIKQLITSIIIGYCFTACVPTEPVTLSTDPIGATVYVNGSKHGVTPIQMDLTLDKDHLITIVKNGYKQETIEIKRIFNEEKEKRNMINSAIGSVQMNTSALDVADSVINSSGSSNPNNFTFEENIVTVTLTKETN